jgi:uncharacterized membrane protein YeaQ/YmgE (transglycosylase-associated protein family)
MTILSVLIVGGLVGYIASRLLGRHEGIIASIVIGIVGSFIGSFISTLVVGNNQSYLVFSWSGFVWSLIGAVVLVAILNAVTSRSHQHQI